MAPQNSFMQCEETTGYKHHILKKCNNNKKKKNTFLMARCEGCFRSTPAIDH